MNTDTVRAAVYCSMDTQEGLFTKLAERIEIAMERFSPTWQLTGIYVDMPGRHDAYERMTADAERGLFDLLVNIRNSSQTPKVAERAR